MITAEVQAPRSAMGKKGALLERFFDLWLGGVLDQQISEIGS